jgi:hypothetical protein
MQIKRNFIAAIITVLISAALGRADEFRGKITKVDTTKMEVVVEGRSGAARGLALGFAVNPDTRIQLGREPGKLEDLQAGDRVRLFFENRNNQRVALSITDLSFRPKAGLGGSAPADNAPNQPPAPAAGPNPALGSNAIAGRLIRVGLTEREIVLLSQGSQGGKEAETTLLVPSDVKITRDQKLVKLEDLKPGEQVTVRTEKREGHMVAAAIQSGGSVTATAPSPPSENRRIERIRQVLKLADWILQQVEEQRETRK